MSSRPFIDFEGKQVIVSGASSGIGRAISVELSNLGASLILIGRNEEKLDETYRLLTSAGHHVVPMDLSDHAAIVPKVVDVAKKNGRIYGMCHSAGVVETRPLSSAKTEGIQAMLDVNLISGIEIARAVCRRDVMEETGGSVLFISSIYALVGMPGQIGYSASKGAVTAAMRAMAIELARRRIRVNSISPGLVETDMTEKAFSMLTREQAKELRESFPLGTGKPKDVARAAVFLLAPQNGWITGVDLVIDGGYTAR
jgi:NAD(P)-dependent dehydrogenase (short-subunit alcohol dehydrogenase family)